MRGVVRAVDAARQHFVVARLLAFLTQAGTGDPDERVEPVSRAQELAGELDDPVAAADVRELVAEHDRGALVGPRLRRARQNHLGHEEPPRHEERRVIAFEELHRAAERELAADLVGQPRPRPGGDRTRPRGEPGEARQADDEHEEAEADAEHPRRRRRAG